MRTRAFKSGNSQAVRIPAEIAYGDIGAELEITRSGDVITIYPARRSLLDTLQLLGRMPKPKTIELIERTEVPEREGD
ncbi:MAG TPA: AbrB/MazE/SpoVT family DNA-binding domain-containing protein [Rhizomicrobium sp.]|jgi:antitoxin VapB